ncbi:MAG TPA: iron-containing alcohol dehydrogenase [Draconibacterium sp.]|nr:iron-containing alcohol dehydrogenase [Draconibacterium sp.]
MGISFQFATSTQIIFENGSFTKVPGFIKNLGSKVLIVSGKNKTLTNQLSGWLKNTDFKFEIFTINSEPTTHDIEKGTLHAQKTCCNVVAGVGGGSVIDSAKAIAALATNKGQLTDYLEVIGKGEKLEKAPLPCIAIPTTAGTGAEVTKNSVIKSTKHNVKVSLRSDLMFPAIAVIDPELTLTMPPEITAITGIDALTHLLETFVSCQSNPFIDMICREGMTRISISLERAFLDGSDLEARENMAMASMLGGMALANVKLGAVHGFAGPLGGMFPIPHGAVCACLLPAVMEVNISVIKEKKLEAQLQKFDEVARILTKNSLAHAVDGAKWINEMVKKLKIPSLSDFYLTPEMFPEIIEKARNSSSMKGNPVELEQSRLFEILNKSL